VRLVVARFNDNLPEYPFAPSVQWATKFAADFKRLGDYFRTHHVRVVNMSWGDEVSEFETWLSKTSPEKDPAKRKADATAIYQVWRAGIEQAIRSAPATLFVAQFLSSPRLNVLDGEVTVSPNGPAVRTALALFPVPDARAAGRPIRVGIRPEWLRLSSQPLPEAKPLEVAMIEPLGAEILVHVRWPGGALVARAPADFVAPEHGNVWIDAAACRVDLFDSDGRRLADGGR